MRSNALLLFEKLIDDQDCRVWADLAVPPSSLLEPVEYRVNSIIKEVGEGELGNQEEGPASTGTQVSEGKRDQSIQTGKKRRRNKRECCLAYCCK
ncbi:hypothetical protein Baya_0814 [Bagarius yarrelli]|uniref:Uncharacterized protein n=1 Tax=Bagarius yarrelli TaxID=175774 RepID=A0A556TJD3_BAGYA|nr:hypothetical protein Baya_0814 [Bagarius yarrelli]